MQVFTKTSDITDVNVATRATFVDWSAVIAGALTAAAVSLVLLFLGSGLGLATVSPWAHSGASAAAFTVGAAIWLIIMQWLSSAFGGYIAGRLRSKWVDMHGDEVFFRDTAQGLLTWVIATLFTAAFLASASASILSGGVKTAATVGAGIAAAPPAPGGKGEMDAENGYLIDTLFRADHINPAPAQAATAPVEGAAPSPQASLNPTMAQGQPPLTPEARGEVTRIVLNGVKNDSFPDADKTYLSLLVAERTGVSTDEATKRVDALVTQIQDTKKKMKEAADTARKTASMVAILTSLSLVVGAFVGAVAAALGGKKRDTFA